MNSGSSRLTPTRAVDDAVVLAADAISRADALLIGAGAGMGDDSGLPDFRGTEGFWNAYPPYRKLGLSFVDLAQPRWFHSDAAQAWGFYGHRRNTYRSATPHAGFQILRKWAESKPAGYFVFTSNVDGHFQKSGFATDRVVECHGSLEQLQCVGGCTTEIWPAGNDAIEIDETRFRAVGPLPQCRHCGGLARPNVLMFDDYEWLDERTESQLHLYEQWLSTVNRRHLVVIELGAGTAVPTVRYECQRQGGTLIRINVREAQVPPGGVSLPLQALTALQAIESWLGK